MTLFFAGALSLAIGALRPQERFESEEAFWARKIQWGPEFDIVLAGDSRVVQGLSPEEMKKYMPGRRIANFGFDLTSFSGPYLEAVENLIEPNSKEKIIVLGVSPLSLTPLAARDNQYLELKQKHPAEVYQRVAFEDFFSFFRPVDLKETDLLRTKDHRGRIKIFHPDGHIAATMEPLQPTRSFDHYRGLFDGNTVSPEIVDELMAAVKRWTGSGIRVVGFRVPTADEMVKIENELSGFKEDDFVKRLTEAGGEWLEFGKAKFFAYDGSHLDKGDALSLSRRLARKLLRQ